MARCTTDQLTKKTPRNHVHRLRNLRAWSVNQTSQRHRHSRRLSLHQTPHESDNHRFAPGISHLAYYPYLRYGHHIMTPYCHSMPCHDIESSLPTPPAPHIAYLMDSGKYVQRFKRPNSSSGDHRKVFA